MNAKRWGIGWLIAFIGFPPAGTLGFLLIGRLDNSWEGLLGGVAAGAVIGTAQMLALRTRWPIDWRWIAATAGGLAVGVGIAAALFGTATTLEATLLRALLTGLLLGATQWLVLKRYLPHAYLWIPLSAIAYLIAWYVTAQVIGESLNNGWVVFGASGALLFQVLMGLVLWSLIRGEKVTA